jgi:hypothetical protein
VREILVLEFRNAEDKLHYAMIGVTAIVKEEDDILIEMEDKEKSCRLDENPVKAKGLKINLYYATEDDILDLMGNRGMFANGIQVIDGRLEGLDE